MGVDLGKNSPEIDKTQDETGNDGKIRKVKTK